MHKSACVAGFSEKVAQAVFFNVADVFLLGNAMLGLYATFGALPSALQVGCLLRDALIAG